MQLTRFAREDEAVSPVIGVILMVAITVILAAVIGTFVLGLGGGLNNDAPQMSFDFNYADGTTDTLDVTFEAGNPVDAERLTLVVTGASESGDNGRYEFTEASPGGFGESGQFGAGSSVTFDKDIADGGGELGLSSATVKVVWESQNTNPDAQRTSTVAVWNGPSA